MCIRDRRKLLQDLRALPPKKKAQEVARIFDGIAPEMPTSTKILRKELHADENGQIKTNDENSVAAKRMRMTSAPQHGIVASLFLSAELDTAANTAHRLNRLQEVVSKCAQIPGITPKVISQVRRQFLPDHGGSVSLLALSVDRDETLALETKRKFKKIIRQELESSRLSVKRLHAGTWDATMTIFDRPHRNHRAPLDADRFLAEYQAFEFGESVPLDTRATVVKSLIDTLDSDDRQ